MVILNFNAGRHLRACLKSVLDLRWSGHLEIVIVDNASSDDSLDSVADLVTLMPAIQIVHSGSNLGFGANNLAMQDLESVDLVALVNPDARVSGDWLESLNAALEEDSSIGAACPLILLNGRYRRLDVVPDDPTRPFRLAISSPSERVHVAGEGVGQSWWPGIGSSIAGAWEITGRCEIRVPEAQDSVSFRFEALDGAPLSLRAGSSIVDSGVEHAVDLPGSTWDIVQNAGSSIGPLGLGQNRAYLKARDDGEVDDEVNRSCDVDAWCGAGVLLRASYLRDVGLFDERLFLYYEDTDLSWRGQARGWRHRYVPTAVMQHEHSFSTGRGSAVSDHHHLRNRLLVVTKNADLNVVGQAWVQALRSAIGQAKHEIWRPVRAGGRPEILLAPRHARALIDALHRAPSFVRSRRRQ